MNGWEATRAVGSARFPEPTIRHLGGNQDWPDGELVDGVAGCTISLYADDPSGALVRVVGPKRDAVASACDRAAEVIESGALLVILTGDVG